MCPVVSIFSEASEILVVNSQKTGKTKAGILNLSKVQKQHKKILILIQFVSLQPVEELCFYSFGVNVILMFMAPVSALN